MLAQKKTRSLLGFEARGSNSVLEEALKRARHAYLITRSNEKRARDYEKIKDRFKETGISPTGAALFLWIKKQWGRGKHQFDHAFLIRTFNCSHDTIGRQLKILNSIGAIDYQPGHRKGHTDHYNNVPSIINPGKNVEIFSNYELGLKVDRSVKKKAFRVENTVKKISGAFFDSFKRTEGILIRKRNGMMANKYREKKMRTISYKNNIRYNSSINTFVISKTDNSSFIPEKNNLLGMKMKFPISPSYIFEDPKWFAQFVYNRCNSKKVLGERQVAMVSVIEKWFKGGLKIDKIFSAHALASIIDSAIDNSVKRNFDLGKGGISKEQEDHIEKSRRLRRSPEATKLSTKKESETAISADCPRTKDLLEGIVNKLKNKHKPYQESKSDRPPSHSTTNLTSPMKEDKDENYVSPERALKLFAELKASLGIDPP